MSPRLTTTVESCTAAALSTDARDKYFISYVGEGSPRRAAGRVGGICGSTWSFLKGGVKICRSCLSVFRKRGCDDVGDTQQRDTQRGLLFSAIFRMRQSGYVDIGDPCPSKKLRAAMPSLDAARTALAASTAKLADRVASIGSCKGSSTSFAAQRGRAALLPAGAALLEVDTECAETAVAEKVAAFGRASVCWQFAVRRGRVMQVKFCGGSSYWSSRGRVGRRQVPHSARSLEQI